MFHRPVKSLNCAALIHSSWIYQICSHRFSVKYHAFIFGNFNYMFTKLVIIETIKPRNMSHSIVINQVNDRNKRLTAEGILINIWESQEYL